MSTITIVREFTEKFYIAAAIRRNMDKCGPFGDVIDTAISELRNILEKEGKDFAFKVCYGRADGGYDGRAIIIKAKVIGIDAKRENELRLKLADGFEARSAAIEEKYGETVKQIKNNLVMGLEGANNLPGSWGMFVW